jgi:uncharacterized SAM-binding protein YcdF (DUF218 family)
MRRPTLLTKRTVYCPTALGWLLLISLVSLPIAGWTLFGETFLSQTDRKPAKVLIVEGWITDDALISAADEFRSGGYEWVITTGEYTSGKWNPQRWCFADVAAKALIRSGVPEQKVIRAPAEYSETKRTFEAARQVQHVFRAHPEMNPSEVNVFTAGTHARRSRLVYSKVLSGSDVGVISWAPAQHRALRWWHSSDRAKQLITESAGWLFELLFDSGRDRLPSD